jgi:hypothetical protein
MATLRFNGTSAFLAGTAPGGLDGAFTIAALVKRVSTGSTDCIVSTNQTGTPNVGFSWFHAVKPEIYNDNAGGNTSPPLATHNVQDTDLWLTVMTRGTAETPRFHIKNLTDATSWAQDNGETAQTTNPDPATNAIYVGMFRYPGVGDLDWFDGDIGLVGWWNGVEMSDGQVQALATNLKTSDWYNHAAGAPSSLTQMTSATPTDLMSLVTWTNTNATLTGDNMTLWSFDGAGSGPTGGGSVIRPGRHRGRYPARDTDWY